MVFFTTIAAAMLLLIASSSLIFDFDPVKVMATLGVTAVVTALLAIAHAVRDLGKKQSP